MKRWVAGLFLVLIAFYLGAANLERCEEGRKECVQVCHILCNDGCATAPMPTPPTPPPPDSLPKLRYEAERVVDLVSLGVEPEKDPPRA